jgi:NitT/TauT family transport system permease protein
LTLSHAENATRQAPAPRNWRRVIERVGPALLIVALVVLWEVLTRAFEVPNFLLPTPTDVARLIVAEWPLIQMHSIATIGSILSGYIAAALFAAFRCSNG